MVTSYSRLSEYDRTGAKSLIKQTNKDSVALKKGSLINDLLFENVDISKNYKMLIYDKPTATLLKLANIIIANYPKIPDNDGILEIIKTNEFWSGSKKEETLIKNFDKPEFWEYLKIEMGPKEATPITPSIKIEADLVVKALREHKNSRDIFAGKYDIKSEIMFEIPYNGVILRGFIDMVLIDHEAKTFRLVDLKTGEGSFDSFEVSFVKWRYYLQEAVYMLAVDEIIEKFNLQDYQLLNFQFLYIGIKERIPVIFNVSDKWHDSALNGFTTKSGYVYKGLNKLIEEVKYHWEHKIYDVPYELIINRGVLPLRSDFLE